MFFWSTFFFDLYEIVTFESGGHCWNPPGLKRKETKKQAKQFVWKLGSSGVNPQLIRAKAGDQSRPISISLKKKKKSIQVGINPLFMENHQQIRVWTKLEREREPHAWNGEPSVTLWRWLQYYNKKNMCMYITSKGLSLSKGTRRREQKASRLLSRTARPPPSQRPGPVTKKKETTFFCSTKM